MSAINQNEVKTSGTSKPIDFYEVAKALLAKVLIADADGELIFVNDRWAEYTGIDLEHSINGQWQNAIDERDRIRVLGVWSYTREFGKIAELELRLLDGSTGESRWHVCRINPIKDADGVIKQWCAFVADVHDQKLDHAGLEQYLGEQSKELALTSAQLSVVTEALTDFVQTEDLHRASTRLLTGAMRLTESTSGFIAVVLTTPSDDKILRVFADSGFGWHSPNNIQSDENSTRTFEEHGYVDFACSTKLFENAIREKTALTPKDIDSNDLESCRQQFPGLALDNLLIVPILKAKEKRKEVVALLVLADGQIAHEESHLKNIEVLTHAGSVIYAAYLRQEHAAHLERERIEASERLRAANEQLLREQEFGQIGNAIPQIVWTATPNGDIDYHNQRWFEYTGLTIADTKELGWGAAVHPEDLAKLESIWQSSVTSGETFEIECRLKRAVDGDYRWHLGRALPIRNDRNEIVKWFGTCTDIHDQIRAQEEAVELSLRLQKSESELRQLAEAVPEVVFTTDSNGQVEYFNQRWYEYTGQTPEESVGSGWQQSVHPTELIAHQKVWADAIQTGNCLQLEQRFRSADGRFRWFLVRAVPFRGDDGLIVKWFGTLTDIEDQKHTSTLLEERVQERTSQLQHLAERHEETTQELQNLAYTISHELQSPLKTITSDLGLLSVRYKTRLGTDADEFISNCVDAAHKTQRMVDDLWIYARIDRPGTAIHQVNMRDAFDRAMHGLKEQLAKINTTITCDGQLPTVSANPDQMQYLIAQLIQNGITFNTASTPAVSVSAVEKPDQWIFAIKDNGIGFDMIEASHMFKMFVRLKKEYPGTGMGLAICKKIVEVHGGNIWADSKPGQGSTFYFSMPKTADA